MTASAADTGAGTAPSGWRRVDAPELSPILESALEAFYDNGFHGTSVRQIASKVGVTVPALYYHHKNKEGILLALLEYSTGDVLARAHTARAAAAGDPVKQLANVIESIVLVMTIRVRLAAVEGEIRYASPENRLRYRVFRKGIEELVHDIVQDGTTAGVMHVTDTAETTRALLAMCQSIPRWFHEDGELTPPVVAAKYVDIALHTVGALPANGR